MRVSTFHFHTHNIIYIVRAAISEIAQTFSQEFASF